MCHFLCQRYQIVLMARILFEIHMQIMCSHLKCDRCMRSVTFDVHSYEPESVGSPEAWADRYRRFLRPSLPSRAREAEVVQPKPRAPHRTATVVAEAEISRLEQQIDTTKTRSRSSYSCDCFDEAKAARRHSSDWLVKAEGSHEYRRWHRSTKTRVSRITSFL